MSEPSSQPGGVSASTSNTVQTAERFVQRAPQRMSHAAAASLRESPPRPSFRKSPAVSPLTDRKELGGSTPLKAKSTVVTSTFVSPAVSAGAGGGGESPTKSGDVISWSVICDQMRSTKEPDTSVVLVTTTTTNPPQEEGTAAASTSVIQPARKSKKNKAKKKKVEEGALELQGVGVVEGGGAATVVADEVEEEAPQKAKAPKKSKKKKGSAVPSDKEDKEEEDRPSRDRSTSPHKPKPASAWGAKSTTHGQVPPPPHFLRPDQISPTTSSNGGFQTVIHHQQHQQATSSTTAPQLRLYGGQQQQHQQQHQPIQPVALQPTSSMNFNSILEQQQPYQPPPTASMHHHHQYRQYHPHQQQQQPAVVHHQQHHSTNNNPSHQLHHHSHSHSHSHHSHNSSIMSSSRFVKPQPTYPPQPQQQPTYPKFISPDQSHIPFTEQGLSDEIYTFVGAAMLRKSEVLAREKTHEKVERCIRQYIATLNKEVAETAAKVNAPCTPITSQLVLFGSYAVGLSTPNSDMDLTVVIRPFPPLEPGDFTEESSSSERRRHRTNRNEVLHFLETLSAYLTEKEKLKAGVISTSKVPVVSVYDAETSIACDISLNMGHMEKVVQLQRAWLSNEDQIDRRLGCGRDIPVINDLTTSSASADHRPSSSSPLVPIITDSPTVFISRAKALIIMTKVALRQWGLCSSFTGGLSSTSVYLLVERFLREGRTPTAIDEKNTRTDSREASVEDPHADVHSRRNNTCNDDQMSIARLLLEFWRYLGSEGHGHGYLVHDIFCVKPSEPYEQIPTDEEPRRTTSPVPTSSSPIPITSDRLEARQYSTGFSGGASMSSVATGNPDTLSDYASESGGVNNNNNHEDGSTAKTTTTRAPVSSSEINNDAPKEFYWYGPGVAFVDPACNTVIPLHLLPDVSRRCSRFTELQALMTTSADGLTDAISGGYRKSWSAATPITNILLDPRLVTSQHGVIYQQRHHSDDGKGPHRGGRGAGYAHTFKPARGRGSRPVHSPTTEDGGHVSTPPSQSLGSSGYKTREYSLHHDPVFGDRNGRQNAHVPSRTHVHARSARPSIPTTPPLQGQTPGFPGPYFLQKQQQFNNNNNGQPAPTPLEQQLSTPRTPSAASREDTHRGTPENARITTGRSGKGNAPSGSPPPPSYFDSLHHGGGATTPFSGASADAPCFNPTSRTGRAILSRTSSRNGSPIPSDDHDA